MSCETIKMEISSNPEYVGIIRLTTSGIANKVGFCLEDIEDLKVAISEACSNTDNTQISKKQIEENKVSSEINKEKDLFDKAVIIADDEIANVKITGKEKVTPGNSIGYIFSISNKSNKK